MPYLIGELARMAGLSVRTLRYYDRIGLLEPSSVLPNGYRSYGEAELLRLQQVLFFRELGFTLDQIKEILDSEDFDIVEALEDQKRLIQMKKARLEELASAIDDTLAGMRGGKRMKGEELLGSLTTEQVEEYKREVREKWGDRELSQSEERMRTWTEADYASIESEGRAVYERLVALIDRDPGDGEVQAQIDRYFRYICNFYDCTLEVFRGLGDMYVADERFASFYHEIHPDLAVFMRDAINIYCDNAGKA